MPHERGRGRDRAGALVPRCWRLDHSHMGGMQSCALMYACALTCMTTRRFHSTPSRTWTPAKMRRSRSSCSCLVSRGKLRATPARFQAHGYQHDIAQEQSFYAGFPTTSPHLTSRTGHFTIPCVPLHPLRANRAAPSHACLAIQASRAPLTWWSRSRRSRSWCMCRGDTDW